MIDAVMRADFEGDKQHFFFPDRVIYGQQKRSSTQEYPLSLRSPERQGMHSSAMQHILQQANNPLLPDRNDTVI
jgi:hypothetical protein